MLFNGIRCAGAAYLVFLGIRMILSRVPEPAADDGPLPTREGRLSMIRRGFWVNVLNPKAIVLFLAFVPQFIRLDQPALPQYLILIGTVIVVDVIVMWGFFATAARPFRRLTRTRTGVRTLNALFGALFLGLAILLLVVH